MSEPIRVLQIVNRMHRAGLETMLMNYYRHMDRQKIQFDFLIHYDQECAYDKEILSLGGYIYRIRPLRIRTIREYIKDLNGFFAKHNEYKIIHCHLDALSGCALYIAKKYGIPVRIAHSHNNGFDKDLKLPIRYVVKKIIPLVATHFRGCSKDALEFMFGANIVDSPKSKILTNAIDISKFSYDKSERKKVRGDLQLGESLVLGHIGRFSYQKNHEFLIDIFDVIHKQRPQSFLLLIGEGDSEANIKEKVIKLGLEKNVLFLGVREDVSKLLCAMDIFVLPSHFEGLGIVLLEAQANGLSCVASTKVSQEVDITRRITFLPLEESCETWAHKILNLKNDRYDGKECLQQSEYDINVASLKLMETYLELHNGGGS